LAEQIASAWGDAPGLRLPPLQPVPRDAARSAGSGPGLPLSFAQQRLWILDQLQPHSPAYNIFVAVRLIGPLDLVALARSLDEIVRRHEALRTTFATLDGQQVQVIAAPRPR